MLDRKLKSMKTSQNFIASLIASSNHRMMMTVIGVYGELKCLPIHQIFDEFLWTFRSCFFYALGCETCEFRPVIYKVSALFLKLRNSLAKVICNGKF